MGPEERPEPQEVSVILRPALKAPPALGLEGRRQAVCFHTDPVWRDRQHQATLLRAVGLGPVG